MERRNNEELLQRIKEARQLYHLSYAKIAAAAGMAVSTVTNQIRGKYKLDIDVVCAILELCPTMPAEWLMRGKGSMIQGNAELESIIARIAALENKVGI